MAIIVEKEDIEMDEKRCILCNKPYNYKYEMFGRGCLDNLYNLLGFSKSPRIIWNKELNLCTKIAWKNHKFFLNKKKKYALAQKYIALTYLNMMNYEALNDIKEQISNDIKNIKMFSKNIVETISFSLNDIYKLFNYSQKFNKILKEIKKVIWEEVDEKVAEDFIKSLSFIFDEAKKTNPISYAVFYSMQYTFWQVVVVGGILADMKLSARLLSNSLAIFGHQPHDLVINDEETITDIQTSEEFNNKIKELIEKYCKDKDKFVGNSLDNEDCKIEFNNKDLFLSIHGSPTNIVIEKNEDETWNVNMEIIDTYDFTDFKNLKEYMTSNNSLLMSIFSSILNNFGVASSEYGLIKPYKVTIKVQQNNYIVK